MTMLEKYKDEIKRAGLYDQDSDYGGMVGKALEKLVECHMAEGHSGFSHYHLVNLFHTLMTTDLLTPLQGTDDEWVEVAEEKGKPLFQNKRLCSVFKCGDDVYDVVGGPVFEDEWGGRYTNKYSTRHGITFPYTPLSKTEIQPEIEWIKKERLAKASEFNKIGINDSDSSNYKYSLVQQEILMWADLANTDNEISKTDYDVIVKIRGFEQKHINYLNAGLEYIGVKVVEKDSQVNLSNDGACYPLTPDSNGPNPIEGETK